MTSEHGTIGAFMRWTKRVVAEGPVEGVSKHWTDVLPPAVEPSAEAMVKLLSGENLVLLRLIAEKKPCSLGELAVLARRKESNLSRTLSKLRDAGIVRFEDGPGRRLVPQVVARRVTLDLDLCGSTSEVRVEQVSSKPPVSAA